MNRILKHPALEQQSLLSKREQAHAELMQSILTVPPKKDHALTCEQWNRLAFLWVLVREGVVLTLERKHLDQLRSGAVRQELAKIIHDRAITVDQAAELFGETRSLEMLRSERSKANGVAIDEAVRT